MDHSVLVHQQESRLLPQHHSLAFFPLVLVPPWLAWPLFWVEQRLQNA